MTYPIPNLLDVAGAITYKNHEDHLKINAPIYFVMDFQKFTVLCPATIKKVFIEDDDGVLTNIKIMAVLNGYDTESNFELCEMNGASSKVGEEIPELNYSRMFFKAEHALKYCESLEWIRQCQLDVFLGFLSNKKLFRPKK